MRSTDAPGTIVQTQRDAENTAPPWARSAIALAGEIAAGTISAAEAVEAHIERIETVEPGLRAVI